MSNGIFTLQPDGTLIESMEVPFESEDVFQQLLARYPNLIAGEQVAPEAPRRWVLVTREARIPGEEDGGGRWSVDHLLLDQDGIPTLIEVKRSTDTRLRREVVGQMLDYAANGVAYWPEESLRAHYEAECNAAGLEPDARLQDALGVEDAAAFWNLVKTNLRAGRIRMVFVADVIPPELRRVVEFLNEQMDPAEVLALELKQYRGGDLMTLVPRVYGQTVAAQRKQPRASGKSWDEAAFMTALREKHGEPAVTAARTVLEWAKGSGLRIWWGTGTTQGSFFPVRGVRDRVVTFAAFWTYGTVEIQFQFMKAWKPFDDEALRLELCRRLNAVPGVSIPEERISGRPGFSITALADEAAMREFLAVFGWYLAKVGSADSGAQ